ncbi:hypothetical protein BC629DRAFT_1042636 [Irpex lacteus]|nr:hypothetical protein BC629DRAFT_1042636 [Irpex lacteus]
MSSPGMHAFLLLIPKVLWFLVTPSWYWSWPCLDPRSPIEPLSIVRPLEAISKRKMAAVAGHKIHICIYPDEDPGRITIRCAISLHIFPFAGNSTTFLARYLMRTV